MSFAARLDELPRPLGRAGNPRICLCDVLTGILTADDLAAMRDADLHVRSVTVVGVKPRS